MVHHAADVGRAFDAVLMDVQMPVVSSHEATRALTAVALAAGMNEFVTQPIDADRLRLRLRFRLRLRLTLARWVHSVGLPSAPP